MRLAVACIGALLLSCSFSACSGPSQERVQLDAWPFQPRSIRILPLTRLQRDGDDAVIEAWVQLRDRDGHPVRGRGSLEVHLDNAAAGDLHHLSWTAELEEPGDGQQSRFDPVTHAYLLPLSLDPSQLPSRPRLRATLVTPQGERFRAQRVLPDPDT